jgi:hypothetical protein
MSSTRVGDIALFDRASKPWPRQSPLLHGLLLDGRCSEAEETDSRALRIGDDGEANIL